MLFWLALILIVFHDKSHSAQISKLAATIELVFHVLTVIAVFQIYRKLQQKDKKLFLWLCVSCTALLVNDLSFYLVLYISKMTQPTYFYFFFFVPFLTWLFSSIFFFSKVIIDNILNFRNFFKVLLIFILLDVAMIFVFSASSHWAIRGFSLVGVYEISSGMLQFIVFDLSILCLMCSESRGMLFFLTGRIILIGGDFWIKYAFITQVFGTLVYGELFWFLGLVISYFGLLMMIQGGNYQVSSWFSRSNTIKNSLVFFVFIFSILSFTVFFILGYVFAIIDRSIFGGLPFFAMVYSAIVVIPSVFMGKRLEIPFKKIESNIKIFMKSKKKEGIDNQFSIDEFIYLQKIVLNAFESIEEKDQAKRQLGGVIAQVAHDIRSPAATISMFAESSTSLTDVDRRMLLDTAGRIETIANDLITTYRS